MALVLHCGANKCTLDELNAVATPLRTHSYTPVGYGELVSYVKRQCFENYDWTLESEAYGVKPDGSRFFGVMTFDTGSEEHGLSIGLRSSHDKSMSVGVASGAQVFVCDNLCFSGNNVRYLRRHTRNVWQGVRQKVQLALEAAASEYEDLSADFETFKGIGIDQDRGYEMLGHAYGHDVLSPVQFSRTMKEWNDPSHEEHAERTAWGFYNAVTQGLKQGATGDVVTRHAVFHRWLRRVLALGDRAPRVVVPGSVPPAPVIDVPFEPVVVLPAGLAALEPVADPTRPVRGVEPTPAAELAGGLLGLLD